MSSARARPHPPTPAAVGAAVHMGWAAVAIVVADRSSVRVVRTERIETGSLEDPATIEPFHRAAGYRGARRVDPPSDPETVVRTGIAWQRRLTLANVRRLVAELRELGYGITRGAVLLGRSRTADSLDAILASHARIHVAEGNAVRESVELALRALGIEVIGVDQRNVVALAAQALRVRGDALERALRARKPELGSAWRKEHREAALAAAIALSNAKGVMDGSSSVPHQRSDAT